MNSACPTCGRIALPPARYCRACYTVFPTPKFAVAREAPRSAPRSLQFLFLLALAGGGWWAYQADSGPSEGPRGSSDLAAVDDGGDDGFDSPSTRDRTGVARGGSSAAPRRARAAAAERAARQDWLLQLAGAQVCGPAGECQVTIRFGSGETARFAVRRQAASTSALTPLDSVGAALLGRHASATIATADDRGGIAIVRLVGRRWVAVRGG